MFYRVPILDRRNFRRYHKHISALTGGYHQAQGTGEKIAEAAGSFLPAALAAKQLLVRAPFVLVLLQSGSVLGIRAKAIGAPEASDKWLGRSLAELPHCEYRQIHWKHVHKHCCPTVKLSRMLHALLPAVDNSGMGHQADSVKDMADALDAKLAMKGSIRIGILMQWLHGNRIQAAATNNQTLQGMDVCVVLLATGNWLPSLPTR